MLLWWNGRHEGLKILWDVSPVPVRVRPAVQKIKKQYIYTHMKKVVFILGLVLFMSACSNPTTHSGVDTMKCSDSTCLDSTSVVSDSTSKDSI